MQMHATWIYNKIFTIPLGFLIVANLNLELKNTIFNYFYEFPSDLLY